LKRAWRIVRWMALVAVACVAIVYAADDLSVRHRMAHRTKTDPLETTQVRPFYAVPLKNGRDEFDFGDTEAQTCVHSLFPHLGYNPCWYMKRQNQRPTIIRNLPLHEQQFPVNFASATGGFGIGSSGYSLSAGQRPTLWLPLTSFCGSTQPRFF
jgi:hypothetical protein